MTPTTSQAVRDAQMELADAWFLGPREATRALANFESAVRADEAAGLVDILARLVGDGPFYDYSNITSTMTCLWCDGLGTYAQEYIDHTPDCPWVEGMNAVAERQHGAS